MVQEQMLARVRARAVWTRSHLFEVVSVSYLYLTAHFGWIAGKVPGSVSRRILPVPLQDSACMSRAALLWYNGVLWNRPRTAFGRSLPFEGYSWGWACSGALAWDSWTC